MESTVGSRNPDHNQASAKSSKGPRLYQLGMTSAVSPSMMSSGGPSSENTSAFASNQWDTGVHHSTSTPQIYSGNLDEMSGQMSNKYLSRQSTLSGSSDTAALGTSGGGQPNANKPKSPSADFIRQTNLAHILEHSDGSPSRFLRTSPNPSNGNSTSQARATRPNNLGFGSIGAGLKVTDQQAGLGPKSAPPQVKTFEQAANYSNVGPWNKSRFDDRWLHRHEEINPQDSVVSSAYPSSTHLEFLAAQHGTKDSAHPGQHGKSYPKSQAQSSISPVLPPEQNHGAFFAISVGPGYDSLRAYVEIAASGQPRKVVAELEQLMSTMLYLRGEGDGLPSMHHFGKHALREFMYKSVFGMDDGSSALSRHNPFSHVDIAGHRVTRKALHDEITRFVEEQVDLMTASSDRPGQNHASPMAHALSDRDMANRAVDYSRHEAHSQYERNCFEPMPQLGLPGHGPARLSPSPIQGFDNLNLGGHQNHDSLVRPHSGMMPAAGEAHQGSVTPFYGQPPMDLHQQQYFPMLQQQVAQQSGHFVPQQFITPQGMVQGPSYLPQQAPTLAFYPGRPINPYAGQMNPYAAQFLPGSGFGMHQLGTPIMQPQLLPNFQPAMGGLPPHMASFASAGVRPMQQYGPQWPQVSGRVYVPSSRTSSPVPRAQSRGGRSVVSDVLILPYRPGSDDMYPHVSAEGTSVRLQELQRQGPSYAVASRPENLPFIETARRTRPAEWGVLRIGNIPYSLTKQEVLGFLGRNAKILTPDIGTPIHIIMERSSGKTMDCYVEFFSHGDAQAAFNKCLLRGNQLRLGDRVVDVCLSTQDELLREMFPKAKNVEWSHGRPIIKDSTDPYNSGFRSFVTDEELLQLVGYADKPHRSNYTQKCLQRPYESMISLLAKFPWFAVDRYTIKTRDEMFKQTLKLISLLTEQLRRGHEAYLPHLSESLLTELLYAGLNAPAFSEQQRWQLCQAAGTAGERIRMSRLVPYWPFEVLGRKAGVDEDFVREYARYLQSHPRNTSTEGPFGTWTAQSNEALGLTTVGQVGSHELQMVLSMLSDVLPSGTG